MNHLFVYGTLLFPEIREQVGGRIFDSQPASTKGFRVLKVRDATFPGAVKTDVDSDIADGEVLLNLSQADLNRFDAYEDRFYIRESIRIILNDGESLSAMIYAIPVGLANQVLTGEIWTREWFDKYHRKEFFERVRDCE